MLYVLFNIKCFIHEQDRTSLSLSVYICCIYVDALSVYTVVSLIKHAG